VSNGYRQKALRKKGHSCEVCGSTDDIEIHHIDGNNANNDIDNLVPLCVKHHNRVHSGEGQNERVQQLSESLGNSGGYARFTVRLPEDLNSLIDERAGNQSRGAVIRDLLEESVYGPSGVQPQTNESDDVDHLEEEVEFLRGVVKDLVNQ